MDRKLASVLIGLVIAGAEAARSGGSSSAVPRYSSRQLKRRDRSHSCDDPAYAFHRSVPLGIRAVSVASNGLAHRAIASAAVGSASPRSAAFSSILVSAALGPSGRAVVAGSERGLIVYYGWHVSPDAPDLNNSSC